MKEQKIFLKCDHCKADVRNINMQSHLYRVHAVGEAPKEAGTNENKKEGVEKPAERQAKEIRERKRMCYWFLCADCSRKSLLTTGPIKLIYKNMKDNEPKFYYHLEIKCKHCNSRNVEMEQMERFGIIIRKGVGTGEELFDEKVDVTVGCKTLVNEKKMRYEEVLPYLEGELTINPSNWELWLRYGNTIASLYNDYNKAIEAWKKAAELNPSAIAPHSRLGETFFNRWKTYHKKGARAEARIHLAKALKAITQKGDAVTIYSDVEAIADHLANMLTEIGFGDTDIYSAPMDEVEKPLSMHTYQQDKNENMIVRMSGAEKAGRIVESAVAGLLYEFPAITKDQLVSELKALAKDFDGQKKMMGERLRQLIKLNLIHEKDKGRLYSEPEIFLGILFIADTLKKKEYFKKLKQESKNFHLVGEINE